EPPLAVFAAGAAVADAARVDRPHLALERDPDRVVEAAGDAVGAAEVHPGAERDCRQLDAAAGDAVHDLVQRPVAPDGDDARRARVDGIPRQLAQLAGARRQARLACEPERGRAPGELRPAASGGAVPGRGIDEEYGGANPRSRP